MKAREIGPQRLMNLQIAGSTCKSAGETVAALGAMQAQDYAGALWSVGLRIPGATLADVERAVERREIVRSWPLRGTLHFVAAADIGWMLDLLAARVLKKTEQRRQNLELDLATLRKVEKLFARELAGKPRTRDELRDAMTQAKISPDGGRLYHCLLHFSLRQVICGVARDAFALLDEHVPERGRFGAEEALAELAGRYFRSHGPATHQDLMRWSGLTSAEAKRGIAAANDICELMIDGVRHYGPEEREVHPATRGMMLLPGFDEYILGYRDRAAILDKEHAEKLVPGANGVFRPTMIYGGQVLGTWKATATKKSVKLTPAPFTKLIAAQERAFATASKAYAKFLGLSI